MKQNKFLKVLLYNWQIKILSLTIAVFIFFVLSMSLQETRTISLPLTIEFPQDMEVTSNIPNTVELVIYGSSQKIYMIDVSNINLKADFSQVNTEGVSTVPVQIDLGPIADAIDNSQVSIYTRPSAIKLYFVNK